MKNQYKKVLKPEKNQEPMIEIMNTEHLPMLLMGAKETLHMKRSIG